MPPLQQRRHQGGAPVLPGHDPCGYRVPVRAGHRVRESSRITQIVDAAADREVLLDTLEAWRDCGGSTERAAKQLFVHPNTVRQRLRRIAELTGCTLSAPRDVAQLCLALEAVRQQAH